MVPPGLNIGYLPQQMEHAKDKSVIDEALTAFNELFALHDKISQINLELAERTDYDSGSYNNQCIYIDYPDGELYFVNRTNAAPTVTCSSNSSFSHTLASSGVAAPYTVSVEFTETGAIFTQEKDGAVRYSKEIDLSPIMDLTDPEERSQITVNVGGRMERLPVLVRL